MKMAKISSMGLHRLPEANLKALPQITGYPQPAQAAPGRGRLRKFLLLDTGAPGPAGPAASRPGARSPRGASGAPSPGTVPGAAGSACCAPPAPGARDRPRGAQPVLTAPRSGSPGGGRGERRGPSRSRVSVGRGSRRRKSGGSGGGGGGGGEEGQRRKEAATPAHASQPEQPGSPTEPAGRPRRRGLYRGARGPRPFLPPPPPPRPAPPSRRLLCVPAAAASPRPHSGAPPLPPPSRRGRPPRVPVPGLRPEEPGDAPTPSCGTSPA
ncbi:uncharacterized protein [Tursiops truncatus]|uniref:uncharacterized protein n=1 Tax=Tursiops truncatus TaxID=9739 RepID=UPI003CCEFFF5